MITDILHIQNTHSELPHVTDQLINHNQVTLAAMATLALTSSLYSTSSFHQFPCIVIFIIVYSYIGVLMQISSYFEDWFTVISLGFMFVTVHTWFFAIGLIAMSSLVESADKILM
jgi:hypothetical protein